MGNIQTKLTDTVLAVNEIYNTPTFQGEGRSIGMPCYFMRLAGCNLACVWCDTPFAWDWKGVNGKAYDTEKELHPMTLEIILAQLERQAKATGIRNLVISGGEPMLQQKALVPLVFALLDRNWHIEVETAGTRPPLPDLLVDQFNVSLKLLNSGNAYQKRHVPASIQAFVKDKRSTFKFVVRDEADMQEVEDLAALYGIDSYRIYIMPEGKDEATIQAHLQQVALNVVRHGWNLTTRLQVSIYGNQRGV